MHAPYCSHWLASAWFAAVFAACSGEPEQTLVYEGAERVVVGDLGPVRGVSLVLSDGSVPEGVTWTVADDAIAAWSGDVLFAKAPGETRVSAEWRGQRVGFALVVDPPMRINFEHAPERIAVGGTVKLAVHGHRGPEKTDAGPVVWRSTKPELASVDQRGVVMGLAPGVVWISAEAHGGTAMLELIVD